ncbi:MAG: DUF2892 domain-containing protein [Candidatus Latescibacterota bacterium]|nr:MAG: DUF2892 domain-containing protein [Candidatus Latescibacterota bacterium]
MVKNMGSADRIVRLVVFLVIAVLIAAKVLTGAAAVVLGIIAVIMLLTSLAGFCPLYVPLKMSTAKKKE